MDLTGSHLVLFKMVQRLLILGFLFFLPGFLTAQEEINVDRSVISGAGQTVETQNIIYSFTVGEPIIGTNGNDQGFITQGFQQPIDNLPITYQVESVPETCPGMNDGKALLFNFAGCQPGQYSVTWENGTTGPSISGLPSGWIHFVVESCDEPLLDSVFISLENDTPCGLNFYTAFSPNGDNVNDTWIIDNISIAPNNLNKIYFYNIWGQKIRTFNNYDNAVNVWDGKNENGADLGSGTYYFVLEIGGNSYNGYIELTR